MKLLSVGLLCCVCTTLLYAQDPVRYFEIGENVWHIEPLDNNGHQSAVGSYSGAVGIFDGTSGKTEWIHRSESFIMDLKTADLDRDGQLEILFVNAGGALKVLDQSGQVRFEFKVDKPLYTLDAGDFDGDKQWEVAFGGIDRHVYVVDAHGKLLAKSDPVQRLVFRIAAGNLDEDQYDEVLVVENRVTGSVMNLQSGQLSVALRKDFLVPEKYVNWENPRGKFYPFSLRIDDLDGDGHCEIIGGDTFFNKQAVAVFDTELNPLWISDHVPFFELVDGEPTEFYSTAFVETADVFAEYPGKEILAIAGGLLRIWNHRGQLLGSQNCAVGFADYYLWGQKLHLSSSPNGDDLIYQLGLNENWAKHFRQISYRGSIRTIKNNTRRLAKQVAAYQPDRPSEQKYDVIMGFFSLENTPEWLDQYHQQIHWFKERFPYDNLRIIKNLKVIEDQPPLKPNGEPWNLRRYKLDGINGTMPVEKILEMARWIEANKIPTIFYIGHSCTPFITLETAEKILQLAPNYCLGFRTAEDEQIELIPEYFEHYFGPLTELCRRYGYKICMTKNKGIWWMSTPSISTVYDAIFAGESRKVIVAATEDSNSRTPEMNLMGRAGLWQAGLIAGNDVSIHRDLFSFNRFQQWEYPRTGHPFLRLLVAHTTLGMTYSNSRIKDVFQTPDSLFFTTTGQESTEIFYHLLGKGLVFSPRREDALGYSPLGVIVHRPPENWLTDAHNGHAPEKWVEEAEMHQAVFPHNGNLWGMTNTPDHAFQKVIFGKQRQFGYQIPATPYGLVAFVPEHVDTNDVANISEWIHTDGLSVWQGDGPKYTGLQAAQFLETQFERAAAKLPFRVRGHAFLQTLRTDKDQYRLFLVDPGWLDPADRKVQVDVQLEGRFSAKDLLSGESLNFSNSSLTVNVPAGLFRIIEVRRP